MVIEYEVCGSGDNWGYTLYLDNDSLSGEWIHETKAQAGFAAMNAIHHIGHTPKLIEDEE